nr:hypothetical protein [Tanacetum cinerariifolium]
TGKFEQWQFRIQQYLQHEHYALWEVIEFKDSYKAPKTDAATGSASEGTATKKGRTVALTTEDIQKRKNDVKARTTLLLALPDEYQLRFKGSETLEQTFNRLQAMVSHLQFMDIEIKQDDLNQKFLTSLAPEWLMHTIVWRNRSDLDTMSLDDLYNHLKTGKKITIQGTDVAGFGKSKVECFNCHKIGHFAPKALMTIDGVGWDWSFMCCPPPAQVYSPPKKDMYWTGLSEFADAIITDYTRPSPSVESNPNDLQNSSSSAFENGESTGGILSKPEIKFMRPADSPTIVKIDKKETARKSTVIYAKLYRKPSNKSTVRGSQRN